MRCFLMGLGLQKGLGGVWRAKEVSTSLKLRTWIWESIKRRTKLFCASWLQIWRESTTVRLGAKQFSFVLCSSMSGEKAQKQQLNWASENFLCKIWLHKWCFNHMPTAKPRLAHYRNYLKCNSTRSALLANEGHRTWRFANLGLHAQGNGGSSPWRLAT